MRYVDRVEVEFYAEPGPLTTLTPEQVGMIRDLAHGPEALCRMAQGLLVAPPDASGAGLAQHRMAERNTRPAATLLQRALELDAGAPLDAPRPLDRRVVGEIRGNAMRDLASVARKIEMLPWDEWGPMEDSYNDKTGPDFDRLIDDLAAATDDPAHCDLDRIYDQLAVPAAIVC